MTNEEARSYLNAVIEESFKLSNGSFRDVCTGIQAGVEELSEQGVHVTRLELEFHSKGILVDDLNIVEERPSDLTHDGLWASIYALAFPRHTPFMKDPLRVARIIIMYGSFPCVMYDTEQTHGLPLSMDSEYRPEVLAGQAGRK